MSMAEKKQESPHIPEQILDDISKSEADGNARGTLAEGGNIDKIRDILFGVQMRDYEKRFTRLEERLLKESADLRDDTHRRFDALETFVKSEFEAMTQRLQAEQRSRDESVQSLTGDLQNAGKTFDKKLTQFEEETNRSQRDLRQQILDQSKTLSDEIRQKNAELSSALDREVAELTDAKTDRASLASLFTEVALRLNNEFKIPGDS
jgi:DNA anti-recombination protein RmuC